MASWRNKGNWTLKWNEVVLCDHHVIYSTWRGTWTYSTWRGTWTGVGVRRSEERVRMSVALKGLRKLGQEASSDCNICRSEYRMREVLEQY